MFKPQRLFLFVLFVCLTSSAFAQSERPVPELRFSIIPLTVAKGVPLQVVLTDKLHFKLHETVHGRVIEPVYAFDRVVIPSGTEVLGTITGVRSAGMWKRVSTMLGGDFTPVRDPQIRFDTLVFEDGTRMPIETSVDRGSDMLVRSTGPSGQLKTITDGGKQSGNGFLKGMLWSLAPYHPQSIPAGLRYNATLQQPLEFGAAVLGAGAFEKVGSDPAAGSLIYARLTTALNSRTTKPGDAVTAVLTDPLFSRDHLLIFPVGSRLIGEVVQVHPAGRLQHTGELAFKFTKIEPPLSILSANWPKQEIDGRLLGVQVAGDMSRLRVDQEGTMRIAQTKQRFFAPAFALFNMSRGFNATSDSFGQAFTGSYTNNLFSRLLAGDPGLGLPAGIAARMFPPAGIGLSVFNAARAVFVNILARGQEIDFPLNTPMEIRVDLRMSNVGISSEQYQTHLLEYQFTEGPTY